MFPLAHIISGGIFSLIWKEVFSTTVFETIVIFLSTFLIDVDHYICYVLWKKDFSLKRAYRWFVEECKRFDVLPDSKKKNYTLGIFPLHSIEFLLVLYLLSFWQSIFFYVFIGFVFHIITDIIWEAVFAKRALYRFFLVYSLLYKWPKD